MNTVGWPTGIRCPRCCRREIAYNGNYFCSGWGPLDGDSERVCTWALPSAEDDISAHPNYILLEAALIASQTPEVREKNQADPRRSQK
jgi:hypothetical protein